MCQKCAVVAVTSPSDLTTATKHHSDIPRRFRRRGLKKLTSPSVDTTHVSGSACICFPENQTWFQGHITTDDDSHYSLHGKLVAGDEEERNRIDNLAAQVRRLSFTEEDASEVTNNNNDVSFEKLISSLAEHVYGSRDYYSVELVDHDTGLCHRLPNVYAKSSDNSGNGLLFTSEDGEVTFKVDKVHRGQKVEMEMQKLMGATLQGDAESVLYTGQIRCSFQEKTQDGEKTWCL